MTNNPQPVKPNPKKRNVNRQLVLRALTDPKFRKLLATEPEQALGIEISAVNKGELRFILAAVKGIEQQIAALADELLCANGGPCGIA